jgi:hypothetical protein
MLTLDHQHATERCNHCSKDYPVSRGSIYDDGRPIAIYLAGLHPCESGGSAIFGIGVNDEHSAQPESFSIQVWLVNDQYEMTLLNPEQSPWKSHSYLGRMLNRSEVLASPKKTFYFDLADCIVRKNPQVIAFFEEIEKPNLKRGETYGVASREARCEDERSGT